MTMTSGRRLAMIALLLPPLLASAEAPLPSPESCQQIRQKIGVLPAADADLLRTLAIRRDCGFTAAEVYRAAHGDKPLPLDAPRRRYRHEHDDDD